MASYIIGINKTFLFQIDEVRRVNINEEEDLVEFFNKQKELIFACNKIDMDFVAKWDEDELPSALTKIYQLDTGNMFEDADGPNDEPTTEPTTEPVPEEPTPEEPVPEEPTPEPETQ